MRLGGKIGIKETLEEVVERTRTLVDPWAVPDSSLP